MARQVRANVQVARDQAYLGSLGHQAFVSEEGPREDSTTSRREEP